MTVIINAIWGGRITQVVDRQISRRASRAVEVVDLASTKVCVVRCSNALLSIAYTGVAVVKLGWMDSVLADCLAHRRLEAAIIQPGTPWLGRSAHMVIGELAINLNGRLNPTRQGTRPTGFGRWLALRTNAEAIVLGVEARPVRAERNALLHREAPPCRKVLAAESEATLD